MLFDIIRPEAFTADTLPALTRKPHDEVAVFFVTHGSLIINFNSNAVRLNKYDVHLSLPGHVASIEETSGQATGYYCRFNPAFLEEGYLKNNIVDDLTFINSFMSRYPVRLSAPAGERLSRIFSTLHEMNRHQEKQAHLIRAYLITAVCEIKHLMDSLHLDTFPSKYFHTTAQYCDLLSKHIADRHDMRFYADRLGITPNHLNKSVRAVTGKPATAVQTEVYVQEAKRQLQQNHKRVTDIAFELGFEDLSYFSRFFKKATGYTPVAYRKKILAGR
jgi:AraC-like DNA-binding protein